MNKMTDKIILRESVNMVNLEIMNKIIDKINHPEKVLDKITKHQYDTMIDYYYKTLSGG